MEYATRFLLAAFLIFLAFRAEAQSSSSGCVPEQFSFQNFTLLAHCLNSQPQRVPGITLLYLPIGQTSPTVPGTILTPDGSAVPNLASTVTMGFNEVEAYDFQKGWSTWVIATGEYQGEGSASEQSYLLTNDAGGFVIKPLANRFVKFSNGLIKCAGAANAGCINVDSMLKGKIIVEGAEFGTAPTTANSNTCVWNLNGHTAIPNENKTGIVDSQIDVGNVGVEAPGSGTAQASICITLANGPVNNLTLLANEINSQNHASYGIIVSGTMGTNGFGGNIFLIGHCHMSQTACIQIGTTTVGQTFYGNNIWDIGAILPSTGDGFNTYGRQNIARIGQITNAEGGLTNAITLQSGSTGNSIAVGQISGASGLSVNDLSGSTDNVIQQAGNFVLPAATACPAGITAGTVRVINGFVTHC